MELPAKVLIHNPQLGLKGQEGKLFQVADAHYELEYAFGGNQHRVLLPISQTALIFADAVEAVEQIDVAEPLEEVG